MEVGNNICEMLILISHTVSLITNMNICFPVMLFVNILLYTLDTFLMYISSGVLSLFCYYFCFVFETQCGLRSAKSASNKKVSAAFGHEAIRLIN